MPRLWSVSREPNHETVKELTRLLDEAKAGRVIGFAYVALYTMNEYRGDIVGQARSFPLLSRGLCRCLEDTIAGK